MKLKLGYQTNNYQIVFDGIRHLNGISEDIRNEIDVYSRALPKAKENEYNIWYDHKNKICFSQAQYHGTAIGKDHHFWTCKNGFISGQKNSWNNKFKEYHEKRLERKAENILLNNEICFEENPYLMGLDGKSVLIVCGGPSSNDVEWQNIKTDHLWTCNQFYKNKKNLNTKFDLVVEHPDVVDINNDTEFKEYIKKYNPVVSFEIEQGTGVKAYAETRKFCENNKYNAAFFHTRYRGQPGLGLRLIVFAVCMGFEDIYIVGVDGRSKKETDGNLMHAFDSDKKIPNWYKRYGDDFQDRQFVIFWDYIESLKFRYDFTIHNLGDGKDYNVLSKLFSSTFPLSDKIKEAIRYEK